LRSFFFLLLSKKQQAESTMSQNNKWAIDEVFKAWQLASRLHNGQKYAGPNEGEKLEYLNHIGGVLLELINALQYEPKADARLAIHCAILHDTVEDTSLTESALEKQFGPAIAAGVMALTKNEKLNTKKEQMLDSLRRICQQPKEVWMVKMADRIVNLQPPPFHWSAEKKERYREEAKMIHEQLKEGSAYLANRLLKKIEQY
jgi:(p)ppGpp synthase/HD superfamily hydrolase